MDLRAVGPILLLVLPAAVAHAMGYDALAHYGALGAVLAFHLGVQARHLAPFGVLIPFVYAAAAVTASFTDGVAALIVAVAAATGAASSLGYHRGLLSVLAAALIGSCEAADPEETASRTLAMFAGCVYGAILVQTVARGLAVRTVAVRSQTALGYSLLLAVLVLVAWFASRAAGVREFWWLPLTVAALGEPWLDGTPGRAVCRLAAALGASLLLLALLEPIAEPAVRGAMAVALLLCIVLAARHRVWWQGFLFTPVLVLLAAHEHPPASTHHLGETLVAFALAAGATVLGKWMLWTLRPDTGQSVA